MAKVRLLPSGKEIEIGSFESILSALEKNGYALPNNCRAGACGECKCKIVSGEFDQGFVLDMALSQAEREEGYALTCMAKPKSDLIEIEYEAEGNKPKLFPPQENLTYAVMDKYMVSNNIVKLILRSMTKPMRFWPGQYITMGNPDKGAPVRCYSIANTTNEDGFLELLITKVEGGKTTKWIHEDLKAGDLVKLNGPYGTFIGEPGTQTPVLCLAAGSGLAPIKSLASGAFLSGGFKNKAEVLFSAKTKEDLIEHGWFEFMNSKFRKFKYQYTLTQEENSDGLSGRVTDLLPQLYPDLSGTSIYIAGSVEFVADCEAKVKELGAKDELIHLEKFTSQDV
jgi:CDP-4-dehydro-6-deoxyglucose reductase